jgi:GNAT superfamily N-acetyltransferase
MPDPGRVLLRAATADDAAAIGAGFDAAVREGWAYLGEMVQRPLYEPAYWDTVVAAHAPHDVLLVAEDPRGVGRVLLEAAHGALRDAGHREAHLFTEQRNTRARAVDAAAGMCPAGRSSGASRCSRCGWSRRSEIRP